MSRPVLIGIGIAAMAAGGAVVVGSPMTHQSYGVSASPGLVGFAQLLFGGGGLTALLAWVAKFVPAIGPLTTGSTPELLQSLVAWLAKQDDKQLERRFFLAVLSTLNEASASHPQIQKLIADLGTALINQWLPGPATQVGPATLVGPAIQALAGSQEVKS